MSSPVESSEFKESPLLRWFISYSSARESEENVLLQLSSLSKRLDFMMRLHSQQNEIKEIVTRHLGLKKRQTCRLGEFTE
jgi:hypothetical protein